MNIVASFSFFMRMKFFQRSSPIDARIVPGFSFAWIAIVVVSLLGQPSAAMREKHAAVDAEMRQLGA